MQFFKFLAVLVLGSYTLLAQAQSTLPISRTKIPHQYQNNYLYINPAFAGSEGNREITLSGRMLSFDNKYSPFTGIASYHGPSGGDSMRAAVGVIASFDKDAPYWKGKFGFVYGRGIQIARNVKLSAGVQLNAKYLNIDYDEWKLVNPLTAPANRVNIDNDLRPDIDGGLWLTAGNFFVGGSIINILEPKFHFDEGASRQDVRELLVTGGYKFVIGDQISITPAFLWHKPELNGPKPFIDFSASTTLKIFVLGATYRGHYDKFTPWVGFAGIQVKDRVQLLISTDVPEEQYDGFYKENLEASLRIKF